MLLHLPHELIEHILASETLARRIRLQAVCKAFPAADSPPSRKVTFNLQKKQKRVVFHVEWIFSTGWRFRVQEKGHPFKTLRLPADFYERDICDGITLTKGQLIVPWSRWSVPFSNSFRKELDALGCERPAACTPEKSSRVR
ncbi:MAG: hypothetical protein CMK59_02805 [Proteobacteria bacterium]|nr:hypothetical protein [Pseudomonadota bacterium]